MNRIRSWIVRTIFGPAQSEAPGDGQVRESWDERRRQPLDYVNLMPAMDISTRVTEDDVVAFELAKETDMSSNRELKIHRTYKVSLDDHSYTELLALVMKYGTGAGQGGGSSIRMRLALAEAEVSENMSCTTLAQEGNE